MLELLEKDNETPAMMESYPEIEKQGQLDVVGMQEILDGPYVTSRQKMREILARPEFNLLDFSDNEEHRRVILRWCEILADEGIGAKLFPKEFGGTGEIGEFLAAFEMLAYHSVSLTIKFGVQFGLFAGSVYQLGTKRHHQSILPDAISLKLPGCFAMTEIGHGSNVRGIETRASYDSANDEFVIHSPNYSAGKIYIGNAARDGQMATVFAQLAMEGVERGVHAFVVPIRDQENRILPGVRIEDCGRKIGLNGLDNGMLWFDEVRIPRENLLNRFTEVDENGKWSSPIESESARFFTMLGTLVGGRMSVAGCGVNSAKTGLAIAVNYGLRRRQFGEPGEPETLLLDYPTHQKRLCGGLATVYALHFGVQELVARHVKNEGKPSREVETRAAALKAYATWESHHLLQTCREACGGEGYLWKNRIGDLAADTDIFTTFEGDNTVLMQLAAKGLLGGLKKRLKSGELKVSQIVRGKVKQRLALVVGGLLPPRREKLTNLAFLSELFTARQEALLIEIGDGMRKDKLVKLGPTEIFNRHQQSLLQLGQAYAENLSLTAIQDAVEKNQNDHKKLASSLERLALIFALERIDRSSGDFFRHGLLRSSEIKMIQDQLRELYKETRKESRDLVDAFGIPKEYLKAPIALP